MNNEYFELGFIKAASEQGVDEDTFIGFMSVLKTAAPFGVPDMPQQEQHLQTVPSVSVPSIRQNPLLPEEATLQEGQASAPAPQQLPLPPGSVSTPPPAPASAPKAPKPPAGAFGGAVQGSGGPDYGFPKA